MLQIVVKGVRKYCTHVKLQFFLIFVNYLSNYYFLTRVLTSEYKCYFILILVFFYVIVYIESANVRKPNLEIKIKKKSMQITYVQAKVKTK